MVRVANMIIKTAYEKRYAIVLEGLCRKPADNMIKRIRDKQLRHRIFQASFKGVQRAIEEKAKELGVPVIYVNPKNISKLCPVHGALITYGNGSRICRCSKGEELWHRDVAACWNLLFKALQDDGSNAPSSVGHLPLDESPVLLGSTTTHDPHNPT